MADSIKTTKNGPDKNYEPLLINPVGATHSTIPDYHLVSILSYPCIPSQVFRVDNQKPQLCGILDSVEDRGFAPLDSQVVIRGRHYASPTVSAY